MNILSTSVSDQSRINNALSAFHVGMTHLLIQVGHWNADYLTIINSNLRLLHQSLRQIPGYRHQVKRLRRTCRPAQTTRSSRTAPSLLQKFRHSIPAPLAIQAGAKPATIPLHHHRFSPGTHSHIRAHLMSLPEGQTFRLPRPESGICLYMPISGRAQTPQETRLEHRQSHWWRRLTPAGSHPRLKSGEVLLLGPHQADDTLLSADAETCILLCVSLLFTSSPTLDDWQHARVMAAPSALSSSPMFN